MATRGTHHRSHSGPSLSSQVDEILTSKTRFGLSRHYAKSEGLDHSGIYSQRTLETYRKQDIAFVEFCKKEFGSKTLDDCRTHVVDYIDHGRKECWSPFSVKTFISAAAKLYDKTGPSFMDEYRWKYYPDSDESQVKDLFARHRDNITRSRDYFENRYSEVNNKDIIDFARGTGMRRIEISHIVPNYIERTENGSVTIKLPSFREVKESGGELVDPHTKGGRGRTIEVRPEFAEHVWKLAQGAEEGQKIFETVPVHIDVHSYRAEFANAVYKAYERPIEDIRHERMVMAGSKVLYTYDDRNEKPYDELPKGCKDKPAVYRCIGGEFSGVELDRAAMLKASESLGHNRESIFALNYLRI